MKIRYCKTDSTAKTPFRKNPSDAGLDLFALTEEVIPATSQALIRTGISLEVPEWYVVKLWAKGRSDFIVGAGVIDSFYEPGEIVVRIFNPNSYPIQIKAGQAICQAVYIPIEQIQLEEVSYQDLENNSERSKTGGILEVKSEIKFLGENNQGC